MNVSHKRLHHKTSQECLNFFRELGAQCFSHRCESTLQGHGANITVMYDGAWHKREHTSHIGVRAIIEYHSGLIVDAVALPRGKPVVVSSQSCRCKG